PEGDGRRRVRDRGERQPEPRRRRRGRGTQGRALPYHPPGVHQTAAGMIESLYRRAYAWVWLRDPDGLSRWPRAGLQLARFLWAVVRDLMDGQLTLRAMSL